MADSREQGYLTPLNPPPDDDALLDLLQPIVSGITGIDGTLVRPRWQPDDTPNMPDYTVNWCAVGIARSRPETYHAEQHVPDADGYNLFITSEEIDVMFSFYGPASQGYARRARDGFRLSQNRAPLQANGMDTLYCSDPLTLPALLTGKWVRRVDMTVTMRRRVSEQYGIRTIIGLPTMEPMGLNNELYITPIVVKGPT